MLEIARSAPKYSITLFYFVLGFVFVFPSVNIWLLLKEKTGLDPGRLVLQMQMVDIPWLLKPLYAWMSDRFPIAGYRRKTYVGMFSLYCAITWMIMPATLQYLTLFYIVWGLENLCLCWADVVVDALVVERVKKSENEETHGSLQSVGATCRSLGKCVGSLLGALMFAEGASSKEMFYFTAMAPLCVAFSSFWIDEKKVLPEQDELLLDTSDDFEKGLQSGTTVRNWRFYLGNMLTEFIRTDMWKFCVVATLYTLVPEPGAGYFYYYQDIMHIPDFELQIISFAHELGLLTGNFIFIAKLRKTSPRKLMTISTFATVACIMWHAVMIFLLPLTVSQKIPLIYAYEFLTAIVDVFLYMPLFVMGAQLCTEGVEGTTYALVLSIQNLGGFIDNFFASQLMDVLGISEGDMKGLWYMSFISAFLFLVPLLALNLLPDKARLDVKTTNQTTNKVE
jgi:hypothetical protein